MIQYHFPGKIVLVTGSSRGMGAAILQAFARAGASCILNYFADAEGQNLRDAEQVAALDPARIQLRAADVSQPAAVEALMKEVAASCGGLDILVNNAGILRDRTMKKMSLDEWHAVLRTNLDGVFYCSKYGAEIMRDGGRIINIASVAGLAGFPGQANYAAAKAGVIGMTRAISKELARRQITVNALAPGMVQTPMMAEVRPERLAEYEKQIPLGRFARPEEIANAVLFLASEETGYITGQTIPITGGWF